MTNLPPAGTRATTTAQLDPVMDRFFDEAAYEFGLQFKPQPTDIIISPYAKCGTTWLQQIAHGLRTGGSMDFEEITVVTPWIEIASDMGWDLEAPQAAEPRLFKSHLAWHEIPKGARYIVSFRHYADAFISLYRYFEPGSISLEDLLEWRWPRAEMGQRGYWCHLASWWEQRDNENVLLLCYEDMQQDHPGAVERIARFMGIEPDPELIEIAAGQSTREFMLAHHAQFDSHLEVNAGNRRAGLPPPLDSAKVTRGPGDKARYQLTPSQHAELDEIWVEQIGARFGLDSYEDFREAVRKRQVENP